MPKLTCECGTTVELTAHERQTLAELTCPNCGVTRRLRPLPSTWKAILAVILIRHGSFVAVAIPALVILPALWYWTSRGDSKATAKPTAKITSNTKPARPKKPAIPQQKPQVVEEPPKEVAEKIPQQPPKPPLDENVVATTSPIMAPTPKGKKPAIVPKDVDDKVLSTIQTILDTNLPDGKWTGISYWPCRSLEVVPSSPVKMARLKFRANNRFGQPEVSDMLFVFDEENDVVKSLNERDGYHPEWVYRRMFDLGLRRTVNNVHAFAASLSGAKIPSEE